LNLLSCTARQKESRPVDAARLFSRIARFTLAREPRENALANGRTDIRLRHVGTIVRGRNAQNDSP
jgi:hypothetical protein